MPQREAGGPPEDRHLDAIGRKRVVESERRQQTARPRARGEDHDGRGDPSRRRVDPRHPPSLDDDLRGRAARAQRDPAPARSVGEGEGRRVGVRESRVGLPRGGADVVHAAAGQAPSQLLGADRFGPDAHRPLNGDVVGQGGFPASAHDLEEADRLEATIAADDSREITEDLQALEGQARLGLVGVVHPDERARLAAGARGQVPPLDQHDVAGAERGQVERRAGADHTPAHDDDVGRSHGGDCGTARRRLTGGAGDPHIGAPKEASMTGMTRRELITGAAAAAGAVTVLPGAARAQTTQKRELIVAQAGDIAFFDPHMSTSSNDIRISFNLYDNLVSRHPDGKLHPGLATEWKLTTPTTWTFKLRSGVKFHNGDPFSSSDVKASIERTYDPAAKTRVSTVFSTIDHIEA